MTPIFIFPGQNSRYVGMIDKFAALSCENELLMDRASCTLGRDLRHNLDFRRNRDVQVGVFLASHMLLATLEREGVVADYSLGLSLGEYNHLVHIGALSFEDALRLLDARGDAYDSGPDGAMASVFPIALEHVEDAIRDKGLNGFLAVGLHNTPKQQVLSGARAALDEVVNALEEEHFIHSLVFEHRLPMHSPLFASVAERFLPALCSTPWRKPDKLYLPNALGEFLPDPRPSDFVRLLARHVCQPVLWRESIELAASMAPDPVFVEIGPGSVLHDMLGRRWLDCPRYKTDSEAHFPASLQAVIEELKLGPRDSAIAGSRR